MCVMYNHLLVSAVITVLVSLVHLRRWCTLIKLAAAAVAIIALIGWVG